MMTKPSTSMRRRVIRFCCLISLWSSCLNFSGCAQFVILSYLLHGPPSIEPDFDAETGESMIDPDKKVAVVCYAPTELKWKFPQIDDQVATAVALRLHENHITVIAPDYVKAWVDQNPDWERASEIGKAFDADYVIEIELAAFSLFEGTSTTLYRGRTEAYVHVVQMEAGTGDRIFSKEIDFVFPTRVPRQSSDLPLNAFQREYLSRLSERIGFLFYDRFHGDMIPWAT